MVSARLVLGFGRESGPAADLSNGSAGRTDRRTARTVQRVGTVILVFEWGGAECVAVNPLAACSGCGWAVWLWTTSQRDCFESRILVRVRLRWTVPQLGD